MDDDVQAELAALRARLDVMERVFEQTFGDKPRRYLGPRKKEPTLPIKCPECGAEPHERCMTSANKPTKLHLERVREQARAVCAARQQAVR